MHGSSEAPDAPRVIYNRLPGNSVRDALDRGLRFGFIASGDGHDGHPGLSQIAAGQGGLAAFLGVEPTRDGIRSALLARRTYATNGPRMLLRCALGSHRMGATFPPPGEALTLYVRAIGTAALRNVDVIRSGTVVQSIDCEEAWDFRFTLDVEDLKSGEYLYVRVVQDDGGAAWSSPFYVAD